MELKKAAAIAGVATLGYIGYALVTAPTPKISRAEGVCSCGAECVCECGQIVVRNGGKLTRAKYPRCGDCTPRYCDVKSDIY
jgi:hypothetical protein